MGSAGACGSLPSDLDAVGHWGQRGTTLSHSSENSIRRPRRPEIGDTPVSRLLGSLTGAGSARRPMWWAFLFVCAFVLFSCSNLGGGCSRIGTPQGWSTGTVADDVLYIGTMEGKLLAIDKDTGALAWQYEIPTSEDSDRAIYARPTVADGVVVVGGYDGGLYAFDATGDLKWQERFMGRIVGGPKIHEGIALVGTAALSESNGVGGALHAVDVSVGDPIWEYDTSGAVWSSPTVANGTVYFGSLDHNVYALSMADGEEKWRFKSGGAIVSGIAVSGALVIFGGFDSTLYALDAETGELAWEFDGSSRWFWATPLVEDGTVYAPSLDGTLYALDAETGRLRWRYVTEGQLVGTPAIVHDLIAVPVADGGDSRITLLESNGSEIQACRIGSDIRTSIEVSDDLIYFGATDHTIRALRIKVNGNPDEEWAFETNSDDIQPADRPKAC